jgi:hypothetical protein
MEVNKCLCCNKPVKNKYCNVVCQNKHFWKGRKKSKKAINKQIESNNKKWVSFEVNCNKCGKLHSIKEYNVEKPSKEKYFCSRGCANSRIMTNETREKIRKKLTKDKKIVKCEKCDINFETVNTKRKYCSVTCKNSIGWDNHKKVDWSFVNKKSYKEGRNYVAGGTTKWFEVECSKGLIKVQGSYEVRTCKILDKWTKEGIIKDWEYSKDRFNYIGIDNKEHTYITDFKVYNNDDTFYYLEIKGYIKENDELKWESVRNHGYNIEVWFLKDIEEKE